jgi:hypothetical protein
VQRLITNLLLGWLVLLMPGAAALDLGQPQQLLPACCRTHGAHHCALAADAGALAAAPGAPAWKAPGCPWTHLLHAALLLTPYLPAQRLRQGSDARIFFALPVQPAAPPSHVAGLPGQRGPPLSIA